MAWHRQKDIQTFRQTDKHLHFNYASMQNVQIWKPKVIFMPLPRTLHFRRSLSSRRSIKISFKINFLDTDADGEVKEFSVFGFVVSVLWCMVHGA